MALSALLGAGLAVALGFLYPVQREFDLGAYSRGQYDLETEVNVTPAQLGRVQQDFGASSVFAFAQWDADLEVPNGASAPGVVVMMTSTPQTESLSFFPDATRLAGPDPAAGEDWIDLDADLAAALGVVPGDRVELPASPTHPVISYTVRSVYGVRLLQWQYSAIASATPAFAAIPGTDEESFSQLLVRGHTPDAVAKVLDQPFYRATMGKFGDPVTTTRTQLLAGAQESSTASLGLIRVLGGLAVLGGVGFLVREVDVFRRRVTPSVGLLHQLGWAGERVTARLGLLAALSVGVAIGVGGFVGSQLYVRGWLAPGLPPPLRPVLLVAVLGALLVVEVTLWWSARSVNRRVAQR